MEAEGEHWDAAFPVSRFSLLQPGGLTGSHTATLLYTLLCAA